MSGRSSSEVHCNPAIRPSSGCPSGTIQLVSGLRVLVKYACSVSCSNSVFESQPSPNQGVISGNVWLPCSVVPSFSFVNHLDNLPLCMNVFLGLALPDCTHQRAVCSVSSQQSCIEEP